jgi:hypothetical protein
MKLKHFAVLAAFGVAASLQAQAVQGNVVLAPVSKTPVVQGQVGSAFAQAPIEHVSTLLSRHDFMYAGESKDRNLYIVRGGKIDWSFSDPEGKGEISDAVMMSNGNILYAHQFGITLVTPDKNVLWTYTAPEGTEVHTAIPIGKDHVLYIQNGDYPVVRVVNLNTNATEKEFKLKTLLPSSTHSQFRHARLTPQGTLLVAHMDLNKVVEYDSDGNELWSFPADHPWGVTPLANGNVLITDSKGVREITRRGDTAWSWTPADAAAYTVANLQQAWRLPNGNTVINNWVNEWDTEPANMVGTVQALEVNPAKQVLWTLKSWADPANLGPATTIQFLDGPPVEDVHFGDLK